MLKELIDEFYLDQQRDREQYHFYITDAGKCPRAVFFKFKNVPREKIDARILRIFERGETLHRDIFNVLYRSLLPVEDFILPITLLTAFLKSATTI